MNDINDKQKQCLNCGAHLELTPGKRDKDFCDTTCRSNYWQKSNRLRKSGLTDKEIAEKVKSTWKCFDMEKLPEIVGDEPSVLENLKNGKWIKKENLPKPPQTGEEYYKQQIEKISSVEVTNARNIIKELQDEIDKPPKNPLIGLRKYKEVRQSKIDQLKKKFNL